MKRKEWKIMCNFAQIFLTKLEIYLIIPSKFNDSLNVIENEKVTKVLVFVVVRVNISTFYYIRINIGKIIFEKVGSIFDEIQLSSPFLRLSEITTPFWNWKNRNLEKFKINFISTWNIAPRNFHPRRETGETRLEMENRHETIPVFNFRPRIP